MRKAPIHPPRARGKFGRLGSQTRCGSRAAYADFGEAQWHVQEINDQLVQVESVKLFDAGVGLSAAADL